MNPRKGPSTGDHDGDRLYGAFVRVKAYVLRCGGGNRAVDVSLRACGHIRAGMRGAARARAFMHTGHFPNNICTNMEASRLPDEHLFGILFHEFGHIFTGEGEGRADRFVFEKFGIPLKYKGKKRLEWVDLKILDQKGI